MTDVKDADPIGLPRRLFAEALGTGLLVTVVVGSGIAASRLSPQDTGLQLLENSTATVFGLGVLILMFGPVSGAHFNPVVTAVDWLLGRRRGVGIPGSHVAPYVAAQIIGGVAGAVLANVMFDLPAGQISTTDRATTGHGIGEIVATAGLVALIFLLARTGRHVLSAVAVGAYIGAAYWFTSSTSFANPAVTIGRIFTDTFAGIAPGSVPLYVGAQILGAAIGLGVVVSLFPGHAVAAGHADHPSAPTTASDVSTAQEPTVVGIPGSPQRSEL